MIFIIGPTHLPNPIRTTTEILREECFKRGIEEPYLLGIDAHMPWNRLSFLANRFRRDASIFASSTGGICREFMGRQCETVQVENANLRAIMGIAPQLKDLR
jgi:hypothetical protein